jgi:hypothetical protein
MPFSTSSSPITFLVYSARRDFCTDVQVRSQISTLAHPHCPDCSERGTLLVHQSPTPPPLTPCLPTLLRGRLEVRPQSADVLSPLLCCLWRGARSVVRSNLDTHVGLTVTVLGQKSVGNLTFTLHPNYYHHDTFYYCNTKTIRVSMKMGSKCSPASQVCCRNSFLLRTLDSSTCCATTSRPALRSPYSPST